MEKYIFKAYLFGGKFRTFALNTGRGCSFGCKFCYNFFMGKVHRHFPVEDIISNIQLLKGNFNVEGFIFVDDYFFADKNFVKSICRRIIESGLKISWHANSRVDTFLGYDKPDLELLKESGLSSIGFGIESGSQRMLDFVNKRITVGQIKRLEGILQKEGFSRYLSFLFGLPTERREDFIDTLKIVNYLYTDRNKVFLEINCYLPYPGTELYDFSVRNSLFNSPTQLEGWSTLIWDTCHVSNFTKNYGQLFSAARILFELKKGGFIFRLIYYIFYNSYVFLKQDWILILLCKLYFLPGKIKA